MEKPLKAAALSGAITIGGGFVVFTLLAVLGFFSATAQNVVSLLWILLSAVLSLLFLNGFLVLGRKFGNTLLRVLVWGGIVFVFVFSILSIGINVISSTVNVAAQGIEGGASEVSVFTEEDIVLVIILGVIVVMALAILSAYTILWGVAIKRLEKNGVPYARVTGILNIVTGATYIIVIGFFVGIAAKIFEIIMLFEASKKFEK